MILKTALSDPAAYLRKFSFCKIIIRFVDIIIIYLSCFQQKGRPILILNIYLIRFPNILGTILFHFKYQGRAHKNKTKYGDI